MRGDKTSEYVVLWGLKDRWVMLSCCNLLWVESKYLKKRWAVSFFSSTKWLRKGIERGSCLISSFSMSETKYAVIWLHWKRLFIWNCVYGRCKRTENARTKFGILMVSQSLVCPSKLVGRLFHEITVTQTGARTIKARTAGKLVALYLHMYQRPNI